jgi:hypothetical protein
MLVHLLVRPLIGWSIPISLRKLITSQFLRAWDLVIPLLMQNQKYRKIEEISIEFKCCILKNKATMNSI